MPPPSSSSSFTAAAAAPALYARRQARRFFSSDSRLRPRADRRRGQWPLALAFMAQGPCCLYVGPVETASKEMLEALYQQARDSYYSGNPLIVDDMFDKVELKLRLYGSKSVVKYPRCSLRQHSTYSDAEEDPSQAFALASVWMLLLAFGTSAILVPTIYSLNLALSDIFNLRYFFYGGRSPFELFMMVNGFLIMGLGCLIGYPIASASGNLLDTGQTLGLWPCLSGSIDMKEGYRQISEVYERVITLSDAFCLVMKVKVAPKFSRLRYRQALEILRALEIQAELQRDLSKKRSDSNMKKTKSVKARSQQQQNGHANLLDPEASWDKDQLGDVLHWMRQGWASRVVCCGVPFPWVVLPGLLSACLDSCIQFGTLLNSCYLLNHMEPHLLIP
ncbi:hypothetical protein C4D60_Mb06t24090 [Musa balbisiana]|uniref:Uncharacterized protein n=1 Tax=Musa balbisiana TaxID=52838 RepID=A0A4V6T449_MUSBA|nr:hypothetical protein C4D60_Mb06t24090 [Musa balbisiana]